MSDAKRKSDERARKRELSIPPVKDPDRRQRLGGNDAEWLRFYLPKVFYNPFTDDQLETIREVGESLQYGTKKCKAAPRGDGKSSIVKYLALKYALYRQVRFPLIVAATGKKAGGIVKSIQRQLSARSKTPLSEDFPLECHVARYVDPWPSRARNVIANGLRPIHVEWGATYFILPTWEDEGEMGSIIMSLGYTSDDLQGCNVYDERPDFVMLDDLDSRDSLAAQDGKVAAKIEEAVDKTIGGLGGQSRQLGEFMLCTITSRRSAAYKYSDPTEKPAWSGSRTAAISEWPERMDLWDEYVALRKAGQEEKDENGQPIDKLGRNAHRFYVENEAEMNRGAVVSNPYNFETKQMPDGSAKHLSALQKCFDYIADNGRESFDTEHQNDPPADEGMERTVLSAYHVQHNCRSGLEQRVVPHDTAAIVAGVDIKKLGLHYSVWAFSETASGCCVDYGFHELNTGRMELQAVELAILNGLHEWRENRDGEPYHDIDGVEHLIDLSLIDEGWKDESWATQPARVFCAEAGTTRFLPCKGESPYHPPKPTTRCLAGDNWHVSLSRGIPIVLMNSDHWKQKVHDGFMTRLPEPGSLALFEWSKNRPGQPHMSFAKHITAEVYERRFQPGFRGYKEGWWKVGSQNHYFDSTYQALVARSVMGVSVFGGTQPVQQPAEPQQYESSVITTTSEQRSRW